MKTRLTVLLCVIATGYAQSPGTFTPTGSMTTPRYLHTATLLADGRVWFG
jgi:peroxiredoxin